MFKCDREWGSRIISMPDVRAVQGQTRVYILKDFNTGKYLQAYSEVALDMGNSRKDDWRQ